MYIRRDDGKVVVVFLECDEHQHKSGYYDASCEVARMMDVAHACTLDGNTLPIVWLRWNPDTFKADGSCSKVLLRDRVVSLLQVLDAIKTNIAIRHPPMSCCFMFYDRRSDIPSDYPPEYYDDIRPDVQAFGPFVRPMQMFFDAL
jgi:hypothetical protein